MDRRKGLAEEYSYLREVKLKNFEDATRREQQVARETVNGRKVYAWDMKEIALGKLIHEVHGMKVARAKLRKKIDVEKEKVTSVRYKCRFIRAPYQFDELWDREENRKTVVQTNKGTCLFLQRQGRGGVLREFPLAVENVGT